MTKNPSRKSDSRAKNIEERALPLDMKLSMPYFNLFASGYVFFFSWNTFIWLLKYQILLIILVNKCN